MKELRLTLIIVRYVYELVLTSSKRIWSFLELQVLKISFRKM